MAKKETVASKATKDEAKEYELLDKYKEFTHVLLANNNLIAVHDGKIVLKDAELAKGLIK